MKFGHETREIIPIRGNVLFPTGGDSAASQLLIQNDTLDSTPDPEGKLCFGLQQRQQLMQTTCWSCTSA